MLVFVSYLSGSNHWNLRHALSKFGDGDSNRNYTEDVADVIRGVSSSYEVEVGYWGDHNRVIRKITLAADGEVVYGGDCEVDSAIKISRCLQCPQH